MKRRLFSRTRLWMGSVLGAGALVGTPALAADDIPFFALSGNAPDILVIWDMSAAMLAPISGYPDDPDLPYDNIRAQVAAEVMVQLVREHPDVRWGLARTSETLSTTLPVEPVCDTGSGLNDNTKINIDNTLGNVGDEFYKYLTYTYCRTASSPYRCTYSNSSSIPPRVVKKDYESGVLVAEKHFKDVIARDPAKNCRKRAVIFVASGTAGAPGCNSDAPTFAERLYKIPKDVYGISKGEIKTYVIGFNLDEGLDPSDTERLDNMAEAGQGKTDWGVKEYAEIEPYSVKSPAGFRLALGAIINQIIYGSYTASNPVISRDYEDLYQAYFTIPDPVLYPNTLAWQGHIANYPIDPESGNLGSRRWEAGVDWMDVSSYSFSSRRVYTSLYDAASSSDRWKRIRFSSTNGSDVTAMKMYFGLSTASDGTGDDVNGDGTYGTDADAASLIEFVLGDTGEKYKEGLQTRESWKLIDIFHSTPRLVGPPSGFVYEQDDFKSDDTYYEFQRLQKTRPDMLIVGSNGGMMHAFRAAINTEDERKPTSKTTGGEMWAYVPHHLLSKLKEFWGGQPHPTYVDTTAAVEDAKVRITGSLSEAPKWRTIAVQGDGIVNDETLCASDRDGKPTFQCGYYTAVDVSRPDAANGDGFTVEPLWEFSGSDGDIVSALATPAFATVRMQIDGQTMIEPVVFLPGIGNQATQAAPIYVADAGTGSWEWTFSLDEIKIPLAWKNSSPDAPHGVVGRPLPVDTDNDLLHDRVYVGDMEGRLWRLDLSSSDPDDWASSADVIFDPASLGYPSYPLVFGPAATYSSTGDVLIYFGQGRPELADSANSPGYFFVVRDPRNLEEDSAELFDGFPPLRFPHNGEVLAEEPVLSNGVILFTTYYPDPDACKLGYGSLWGLEYLSGAKAMDKNGDGTVDSQYIDLGYGVPSGVTLGFNRWYVAMNNGSVGGTSGQTNSGVGSGRVGTIADLMPYSWVEVTGR